MTQITKSEAAAVRSKFPSIHVRQTVHHYYVEEDRRVMAYLNRLRNLNVVEEHVPARKKRGGR